MWHGDEIKKKETTQPAQEISGIDPQGSRPPTTKGSSPSDAPRAPSAPAEPAVEVSQESGRRRTG